MIILMRSFPFLFSKVLELMIVQSLCKDPEAHS